MSGDEASVLIAAGAYILSAQGSCYSCSKDTIMIAFMVLPPFVLEGERTHAMDEDGGMLRYIESLPPSLQEIAVARSGGTFKPDFSNTIGSSYWMNHCFHCGAKQGDYFVHGPDGPFWPNSDADMDRIESVRVEGPLRFPNADTAYSGAMSSWRDRKEGVPAPPPRPLRQRATKK